MKKETLAERYKSVVKQGYRDQEKAIKKWPEMAEYKKLGEPVDFYMGEWVIAFNEKHGLVVGDLDEIRAARNDDKKRFEWVYFVEDTYFSGTYPAEKITRIGDTGFLINLQDKRDKNWEFNKKNLNV